MTMTITIIIGFCTVSAFLLCFTVSHMSNVIFLLTNSYVVILCLLTQHISMDGEIPTMRSFSRVLLFTSGGWGEFFAVGRLRVGFRERQWMWPCLLRLQLWIYKYNLYKETWLDNVMCIIKRFGQRNILTLFVFFKYLTSSKLKISRWIFFFLSEWMSS